ncbi:MAG: metallophosphoesterase [Spirochaetota bacterium]|nr:metallophosphoesterase [Spirochaetota bacterium]
MMKILHTADIHLQETSEERWEALFEIIELGNREEVDILLISGDLFDRDIDANKLRIKIRKLFSGNRYRIYILPGNHDSKSFEGGSYLGENAEVICSIEDVYEFGNVRIVGLPFMEISEGEIYSKLNYISSKLDSNKTNILLYHGELLDSFYSRKDFGNEDDKRYMPVKLDYFRDMNFDYILAGHFHTTFNSIKYNSKKYFVYPGSPISITRRETGKRGVNIFSTGEAPIERYIDTPYYDIIKIELNPYDELDPLSIIRERLCKIESNSKILLTIKGYINCRDHGIDEKDLTQRIESLRCEMGNIVEAAYEYVDISRLLEDNIYQSFNGKLNNMSLDESEKVVIRELFIRSMMEAGV